MKLKQGSGGDEKQVYILFLFIMEVTTSNFSQAMRIIEGLLPRVEAIAFDLEFTGLRFEKFERDHINYLPYEKYRKLKYVAETYQILQLGLSLVVFEDRLKVYPFNFYLFPRSPIFYDKTLSMQLGCVKFNAEHGMDWNKWIREGVNYIQLTEMHEAERNDRVKPLRDIRDSLSPDHEPIVNAFLKAVDRAAKAAPKEEQLFPLPLPIYRLLSTVFEKYVEEKGLDLSIRYLPGKEANEQDLIVIGKITKAERKAALSQKRADQYGFTILFEQLWASKKPIVGHNCLLDLLYLHHCFLAPLPDNYFDFKDTLKKSGNTFFDTKYIANKFPESFGTETRLQDLIKTIRTKYAGKLTTLSLQKGFDRYDLDKPSLHEAGFDSYVTAWVFVQMQKARGDVEEECRNRLNMNFSFFRVDLGREKDEIDERFARNLLRVNVEVGEDEDVRRKRTEVVRRMREGLAEVGGRAWQIHEGYREIFVEVRENKREVLRCLARLRSKKVFSDIKTFAGYLEWQQERVRKAALTDINRENRNNNRERRFPKQREDSQSEKSEQGEARRVGKQPE